MRVSVLSFQSGKLLRGVALGLIAGLGAGCSSDFARFAPTSGEYTGSINQQQIIHKRTAVAQPFPEDAPAVADTQYDEPTYTGSIENGSIRPVASSVKRTVLAPVTATKSKISSGATRLKDTMTAPVTAARRAVTETPLSVEEAEPVVAAKKTVRKAKPVVEQLDDTSTGSVDAKADRLIPTKKKLQEAAPKVVAKKSAAEPAQEGWSTIGGTWITAKQGETVYNLAKRFGVPANAIVEANGLASADALKSGQKVIIPTYIYSSRAKVSAPDANAETQLAKSTTGTIADTDNKKAPLPAKSPARENVAVLPTATKVKTKQVAASEQTTNASPDASPVKLKTIKTAKVAADTETPAKVAEVKAKPTGSTPGTYTVASGDSLYLIAKKNGTTVDRLKAANGMTEAKLKIGQVLKVPAAGETVVASAAAKIDPIVTGTAAATPKKPAVAEPVEQAKPIAAPSQAVMDEADKDTAAAPSATGISKLRWPVRGRTLVGYGQADAGRTNDGVDISVPVGTPVKAAENGVVIYSGTGLKDFGNTVLIRHENGLVTVYGHNGDLMVKRGENIKRGQEIARSGMSGNTKVPKLHFEVRKNSKPVNPVSFLE